MIELLIKVSDMSDARKLLEAAMGLAGAEISMKSGTLVEPIADGSAARSADADKTLVWEETRSAGGTPIKRINIKETARKIGKTPAELRRGKWPRHSTESTVKFAMLARERVHGRKNKNSSPPIAGKPRRTYKKKKMNGAGVGA